MAELESEVRIPDKQRKVKDLNIQLEEHRINIEQVKNSQDLLLEKLKNINKAAVKVEEAKTHYRMATEALYQSERETSNTSDSDSESTTQLLSQEELFQKITDLEHENSKKIESIVHEIKDLEEVFLKETNNQIFALKKRLSKTEDSFTSISENLTEMQKWKQKKDFYLWIAIGLSIVVLFKVFF